MRTLRVRNFVKGTPEEVFAFVTVFPTQGELDTKALEEKYGQLQSRDDNTFTFLEDIGGGITWECVFDPPAQRKMRAIDSTWSDRTDRFEAADGGTRWTITWRLKATGIRIFTQWLTFQLRVKRRIRSDVVLPVVKHFETPDD